MHTKKERLLFKEGESTWIHNFKWITFLVMMPCHTKFKFPYFVEKRCTHSNIWKGIDDNFMTTHELLTSMYSTLSPHTFYVKIDPDTLILPNNLNWFLDKYNPEYFGSHEVSTKNVKILDKTFNYAQGGVEGFSHRTLQIIVNDMCVERIGMLHCSKKYCLNKLEDVAVGACVALNNISFTSNPCFFAWGPCNIYKPDACAHKMCNRTLSIHKLKNVEWYRLWWKFLTESPQHRGQSPL